MFIANDVMTRNITTISDDTEIRDAIRLLVEKNVTGLPVVDTEMRLIGIVTEKDLLNVLYKKNVRNKTVEGLMTRDIVSFDINDSLLDVYRCLMNNSFRRVPILSGDKLVGIISRRDIIKFLSRKTES